MRQDVFAALARVLSTVPGDGTAPLQTAMREATALIGADVAVLRLPHGSRDDVEMRFPEGAPWPPAGLVKRWHAQVVRRKRAVTLSGPDRSRRPVVRSGLIVPVFSGDGAIGALGVFSASRIECAPEDCPKVALVMQAAISRGDAERLRHHTEAITTTEIHDRVTREIHDGPLQLLSGIMLHLRLVRATADARSSEALEGLEIELEQAIRQTRALIRNLRVTHPEATLEERVRETLTRLERTRGLAWSLRWQGPDGAANRMVADEVFQVINEALANVYRHSSAKHVEVQGRAREDIFEVTVRDDGVGFDVAQALRADARNLSFGLISMQERVSALGGTLTLRSQSGRGTRVLISLPMGRLGAPRGAQGDGGRAVSAKPGKESTS